MKRVSAEASFSAAAKEAFADKETARTMAAKVLAARSVNGNGSFVVSGRSFTTIKKLRVAGCPLSQVPKKNKS
jgi:hypothetical protein